MTTTMNRLPVATWNPLGVNYAPASAALPTVPADGWAKAETLSPALPAGVTAPAKADFGDFAASGMGTETDTWLAENANLVNHLAVSGTADAPIVFENTLDAAHPHALTYLTIDAAEGSSLTVVQVVRGDAENGVSASLTRIRAAENAHVTLVQVQLLGNRARRWNAVAIEQGKSARVEQVREVEAAAAEARQSAAAPATTAVAPMKVRRSILVSLMRIPFSIFAGQVRPRGRARCPLGRLNGLDSRVPGDARRRRDAVSVDDGTQNSG